MHLGIELAFCLSSVHRDMCSFQDIRYTTRLQRRRSQTGQVTSGLPQQGHPWSGQSILPSTRPLQTLSSRDSKRHDGPLHLAYGPHRLCSMLLSEIESDVAIVVRS